MLVICIIFVIYRLLTENLLCVIGCSIPLTVDRLPESITAHSIASHNADVPMPQTVATHIMASHNTDVQLPPTSAAQNIASHNTDIRLQRTSAAQNISSHNADVQTPQALSVASVDSDVQVGSRSSSSHTGKTCLQHSSIWMFFAFSGDYSVCS